MFQAEAPQVVAGVRRNSGVAGNLAVGEGWRRQARHIERQGGCDRYKRKRRGTPDNDPR